MTSHLSKGRKGEDAALWMLRKKGYTILERNFRTRYGEIDIVARHGETLVFIEVKTRSSTGFGSPVEAVGYRKRERIIKATREYLRRKGLFESDTRFDVVSVMTLPDGKVQCELIEDAFGVSGGEFL